ncbi:MAG: hypothetical protein NWF03_08455 [Candidatus Bathyarchaeota archaeon]|nr:hypothetical protein [Candidatus Bathyarchaeota archaeon]
MVTEIRSFFSLRELSESVEQEICTCKTLGAEYGEKLGELLRKKQESNADEEWVKELSGLQKTGKDTKSNNKSKGKGNGKKKDAKSGWIQFKDIMLSTEKQGEAQILFDAVENLKEKETQLEKVKENIEDLKKLGLGENIIYLAYIHQGVPERIVLNKKDGDTENKFEFDATISLPCPT